MPGPLDSAKGQPRPDPNEKLVKVFDSEDESEALVVKGLLDSAGIDSDLTAASMVQDTFPGLGEEWLRVAVRDRGTVNRFLRALDRAVALARR